MGMPSLSEGSERFWKTLFGGVTAIGLIGGGAYTIVQYEQSKEVERQVVSDNNSNHAIQVANTELEAQKPFYQRQLDLCNEASSVAATLATPDIRNKADVDKARGDFWRLYWGPLSTVEDDQVETAMVEFGRCLDKHCNEPIENKSLELAHACRDLISKSWNLNLPGTLKRDSPESPYLR